MRTTERTSQFKRDYRRESKGRHRATLDSSLRPVVVALAEDQPLALRHRDHPLSGEWADHRDCHVKPDLVLIYRKPDPETLLLVRLRSHAERPKCARRASSTSNRQTLS
jgi:mRNA interferase YafQ